MSSRIVTTNFALNQVAAPNLPLASTEYSRQYLDQLNNVLRLYFNRIDANFNQMTAAVVADGTSLQFPNGSFYYGPYTALTANAPVGSTSAIQVTSTDGFLSAGSILIDSEVISYTGKTSTTFTGITRGANLSTDIDHYTGAPVTGTQFPATSSVAIALNLPQTTFSNGVSVDATDSSKIVHANAGIYNFQFAVQATGYSGAVDNATLWIRKNGTDVPNTSSYTTIPAVGSPGTLNIARSITIPLDAGDYIQLMFANAYSSITATTLPPVAAPVYPVTPSVAASSTFVSALY